MEQLLAGGEALALDVVYSQLEETGEDPMQLEYQLLQALQNVHRNRQRLSNSCHMNSELEILCWKGKQSQSKGR